MEEWKKDFIDGLKRGKSPIYLSQHVAGLPLAAVQAIRFSDIEFKEAWDEAAPFDSALAEQRKLTPATLEDLMWSHCSDEEIAAYFAMSVAEFKEIVAANPALEKVHTLGPYGGKAILKKAQFDAARDGDRQMMTWLGKQHLNQNDTPSDKVNPQLTVNFNISDPGESYRQLLGGGTLAVEDIIEVKGEEVDEQPSSS